MEDLHEEKMGVRESLIDWVIITKSMLLWGRGDTYSRGVFHRGNAVYKFPTLNQQFL